MERLQLLSGGMIRGELFSPASSCFTFTADLLRYSQVVYANST